MLDRTRADARQKQSRFHEEDADFGYTTGSICNGLRTIAVAAHNEHSTEKEVARFSSAGPTRDGRVKPDLCAPGVYVLAARSAPRRKRADETPLHVRMSGTSMASPHVAGTVALMFEAARRPLRIEETRNLLLSNTRHSDRAKESLNRIGSGYLDIERAVAAVRESENVVKALPQQQIAVAKKRSVKDDKRSSNRS